MDADDAKAESGKQKFILAFSFPDFSFPFALAGSALLVSYLLLRAIAIDPLDEAAGLSPTSEVATADYAEGADKQELGDQTGRMSPKRAP